MFRNLSTTSPARPMARLSVPGSTLALCLVCSLHLHRCSLSDVYRTAGCWLLSNPGHALALLRHPFQVGEDAILDPLLIVRLICSIAIVHQAAQVAQLVNEAVEFCDVVRDIPHACTHAPSEKVSTPLLHCPDVRCATASSQGPGRVIRRTRGPCPTCSARSIRWSAWRRASGGSKCGSLPGFICFSRCS